MKPRLGSLPPTIEDHAIWFRIGQHHRFHPGFAWVNLKDRMQVADRIDADLMHTRTHRATFWCAICWEHTAHEACTVDHEIRLRRPFHPNSLGALLRETLR